MQEVFLIVFSAWLTSYLTAKFMKGNDDKKRAADIANNRRTLAKALASELQALLTIYGNKDEESNEINMKVSSEPPKQGSDIKIAYISQNYVSVYERQLEKIGLLNEDDIPYIIGLYTCIKGLIDSHILLAKRWEMYARYTRDCSCITEEEKREERLKYKDVANAHRSVWNYQKTIYELYPNVLTRLSKYETSKED